MELMCSPESPESVTRTLDRSDSFINLFSHMHSCSYIHIVLIHVFIYLTLGAQLSCVSVCLFPL